MTVFRTTLLAAALTGLGLASPGAARAEPVEGLYVGAGAGYNLLQDMTATVDAMPGRAVGSAQGVQASAPMKVRWGGGYVLAGAVGWGMGNGVRLEAEGTFRNNQQARNGNAGGGGQQTQFGLMGNVLYDIDVGLNWMSPYVGIGAGYQAVGWNHVAGQASGIDSGGSPTSININQTLGGFAYQVIIGVSFPVEYVPGLAVTAEYRYMNLVGSRAYGATGNTPSISATYPNNTTHAHVGDDANHSLLIGLRYAFNAPGTAPTVRPPPAAAPVPAPAAEGFAARTYLVFFDWDSAALTPRARDIIAEAVRNSAHVPHTRIEVTGHADRTGSESDNQTLSLRRARVVASELQRWGVPPAAIDIHAAGDKRPLVPTDVGVRQPENRRVEIVYR